MELQELIWSTHADAKIGFRFHIGNLLGFSAHLTNEYDERKDKKKKKISKLIDIMKLVESIIGTSGCKLR